MRNFVDQRFLGEESLRAAIAAESAGHRRIGVNNVALEPHVRGAVKRKNLAAGVSLNGSGVAAISARSSQHDQLARNDFAVPLHAHLHPQDLRVPAARHVELFLTRVLDLDRTARRQRESAAYVLEQHLLLAAESSANTRFNHAHPLKRDLQDLRDLAARMIRNLRAGADDQAIVGVQPTDGDVRFDGAVLLALRAEFPLEDVVGFAETALYAADFLQNVPGEVARGVVNTRGVGLVVNHWRARGHGLLDFEYGRQVLILHLDEPQRFLGDGPALRGNSRNPVAHEPDFGIEQVGVFRRGLRPSLSRSRMRHARDVPVSQNGVDAGKRLHLAGVDVLNARVRPRARQDLTNEHALQMYVVGERRAAGNELDAVHFLEVLANDRALGAHPYLSFAFWRHASAAASTASTGFK